MGGGERFVEELTRAMARRAEVKLVSFGRRPVRERPVPGLERVVLRSWSRNPASPIAPALLRELAGADVVHCHQYFALPTFVAALWSGRLRGKPVFVTDLGGGGWTPAYHLDQSRWIAAHLPLSHYAARLLPGTNQRHAVIYGGVDPERFSPRAAAPVDGEDDATGRPRADHDGSVVFLGRLLPHKGVHLLIEGLPEGVELHVIGSTGHPPYEERLLAAARGKRVRFHRRVSDAELVHRLQSAMALVHPTPVDASGGAGANELFGLALVEAMACGCPVIASRAASLPEIVEDGETGLLVPPNDPAALGSAIERLGADGALWRRLSRAAHRRVEERFTWDRVVDRCLHAYGLAP